MLWHPKTHGLLDLTDSFWDVRWGEGVAGNRTRLGRKQLKRWLNGKAITDIAENIRKIAHVLVQTWKGWDINSLFRG